MTRTLKLRADAVDRLTAVTGVKGLNRKQQAALLNVNYAAFWRLIGGGRLAGTKAVADLLVGVDAFAKRYDCPKPTFEELFEIQVIERKSTAAIAA